MRKLMLLVSGVVLSSCVSAQLLTWTGLFPKDNDNVSITVDASKGNQGLLNYTPTGGVYVHTGVITNQSSAPNDWRYVKFNQNFNQPNPQLLATYLGANKWKFDITNIRAYYGVPAGETIQKIAILFRNADGSRVQRNADGSDMYVPVYDNSLAVHIEEPFFQPLFNPIPEPIVKQVGDNITLKGAASKPSTMKWLLNGVEIQSAPNATTLTATPTLLTTGNQTVILEANDGSVTRTQTFQFFVAAAPNIAPLPAGVRDGINYETGNTSVVLVLYAPGKSRVSVIGEFAGSNWVEQNNYVMNKTPDGNYWWLRITGLTPGQEYAFQYLVNGTLKVAEPYAEKILDPWNDAGINASTYPGIKPYPTATSGIVSLLQTAAPAYGWMNNTFSRPDKRNLVVYELLLRDFLAAHDWNSLRDTLTYLKRLGINAIEIMPFNEFEGNESWGYNPDFFLAPDKYYGPKNSLKRFVDSCHNNGIAVIMDIALNHTTGLNPLAALYWNSATSQPAPDNPWLNVSATHPFNVFNDFNHESLQTRYFTSRVVEHWLQEYKLDGFRFDLSKGFTQTNSGSDVGLWSQYDASRVAIWKRYYDTCQLKSPGSYVILEHFADDNEEVELSGYGMLLWGNANFSFSEASMGWITGTNSNFERYLYNVRGFSHPHLLGYMESHDEERLMYKNLNFGNSSNASHNVRDLNTGLKRVELCASFFLAAPGPKMIWEFGELGYDFSINRCVNGTVDPNCRLDKKPIRWDYKEVVQRKRLFDIFSAMNKLRFHGWYKDVFTANNINLGRNLNGAIRTLLVRSANDTSILFVVGNFDVNAQTASFSLPVAGTWYDYLQGGTFMATGGAQSMTLQPGEYHVLLNRNLVNAVTTPVIDPVNNPNALQANAYPNPAGTMMNLEVYLPQAGYLQVTLHNVAGQELKKLFNSTLNRGQHLLPLSDKINNLPGGVYYLNIRSGNKMIPVRIVTQ
jgi:hypothetical protein